MADILLPESDFLLYTTPDGEVRVDVLLKDENVWLTQRLMAELFGCSSDNVSLHLRHIYDEGELVQGATTEEFSVVQKEGNREINRKTLFYSLEAIIAVGYRVNSEQGRQFRTWATDKLKRYVVRGYAIDAERFKKGTRFDVRYFDALLEEIREIRASERVAYQKITDIYATAIDYSGNAEDTELFFATVQNKLHWAMTGKTAAELIADRANSTKPKMGLTNWRKAPKGRILPSDVGIAKNYLEKQEIQKLNHIVDMYLDYAELQASRGRSMRMTEWKEKLDAFLKFNELDLLNHTGRVSHEVAQALAEKEYEKFRVIQDREFVSDFDEVAREYLETKIPPILDGTA